MIDRPDANPDSPPPESERGSIEQIDSTRREEVGDIEQAEEPRGDAPDPRNGAIGGTDGVVKNQESDAQ